MKKCEPDCPFCQGTGVAEYFDIKEIEDGDYLINDIPKKLGVCPELTS